MSSLVYRAKLISTLAVSLLILLFASDAAFMKRITPPGPTGTWAAAGNGLNLSSPRVGVAALRVRSTCIFIASCNDNSRVHLYTGSSGFISITSPGVSALWKGHRKTGERIW